MSSGILFTITQKYIIGIMESKEIQELGKVIEEALNNVLQPLIEEIKHIRKKVDQYY